MKRTTQKRLAQLFSQARKALGLPNKNEVFTKLVPYNEELSVATGVKNFSITPYANDDWAVTWVSSTSHGVKHNWLQLQAESFKLAPAEFSAQLKETILARSTELPA